jgi:hypothetical protein
MVVVGLDAERAVAELARLAPSAGASTSAQGIADLATGRPSVSPAGAAEAIVDALGSASG